MQKQIIKINSDGNVERLISSKDGKMQSKVFSMDKYFSFWLKDLCEYVRVAEFRFDSLDSVYVKYLGTWESSTEVMDIQLILDESALDNQAFMNRLHFLESTFESDKEAIQRMFQENVMREARQVSVANTCMELLQKVSKGESLGDLDEIENPAAILSYFYSHKAKIEKQSGKFLSQKQNKRLDSLLMGFGISFCTFLVSFMAFLGSLLLGSNFVGGISLVFTLLSAIGVWASNETHNEYEETIIQKIFQKFTEEFEEGFVNCVQLTKSEEFEMLLAAPFEYMYSLDYDYANEKKALDSLKESLSSETVFDEVTRLEEVKKLLRIEWHIFTKEKRIGRKEKTPYTIGCVKDRLYYIGFSDDELEDGLLKAFLSACESILETPFFGCELEVTRLTMAIIEYVEKMGKYTSLDAFKASIDYSISEHGFREIISDAITTKNRAVAADLLKDARDSLAGDTKLPQEQQLGAIASQGNAMQMGPVKKNKDN